MYLDYQKEQALTLYDQYKSVTKVIQSLGYPTRQTLYKWIEESSSPAKAEKQNTAKKRPRCPSANLKLEALHRCFELGENIQSVSEELGYSRTSIYTWRRKYLSGGVKALMTSTDTFHLQLSEDSSAASLEIERLKAQIQEMDREIKTLRKALADLQNGQK